MEALRTCACVAVLAAGCEREPHHHAAPIGVTPAPRVLPIVGHAGPNELFPDEGWMPIAGQPRAAFEARTQTALTADLPPDAQLGTMWTGGAGEATWILTGDAAHGYAFRFDANLDLDLSNDAVYPLAKGHDGDWGCDVRTTVVDRAQSILRPIVFRVDIHAGEVAIAFTTQRRGALDVAGKHVPFVLSGRLGRYGGDKEGVSIDTNGDGIADTDPRSDEAFLVRDHHVTLDGVSYAFDVADDGSTLTLTADAPGADTPGRPSLRVGAFAPLIDAVDLTGRRVTLADLRGKVVVLDFWARWCKPCVESIPDLVALEAKSRNAGLAVVSVVLEDDPQALRAFVAEHHMAWHQIAEAYGGPIQDAYRIVSVPELYVVGRTGNLACSRCEAFEQTVADELKK